MFFFFSCSSAQDGYPPSSTSYSGQFEVNGYPSSVTHQDQQRVDASGVQYSDGTYKIVEMSSVHVVNCQVMIVTALVRFD